MRLNLDDLSDEAVAALGEELKFVPRSTAVLAEYKEADVVSIKGTSGKGVVSDVMTKDFEFPVGETEDGDPKLKKIEASKDAPVYIVVTETSGLVAVSEDQISKDSFDVSKKEMDKMAKELKNKGEAAGVYDYMDDPCGSVEELREAKRLYIIDHHTEELSETTTEELSLEELLNIPGVNDPGIGFSPGKPEGWTRKSFLQAWVSLGASWTSCVAGMTGNVRSPKRWCAALKDTVYMTTYWRNRF